ncbi:hypothetical protein Tco_0792986 [Tanacetum coccineum]
MCSFTRKEMLSVGLLLTVLENEFFQDFQDLHSESSDDNTNVVNAPREPIVVNQDPGKKSSPSPLHIDHCCHECGDSLDGIFCRQCTCKSCGKGAHYGYNCPPKVPIISNPEPCNTQTIRSPTKLAKFATTMSFSYMPTILEVVEIVVLEVEWIDDDILLTIEDDILREKIETNTFDNSIPESETFRFNLEEISSGSPTTHSELSLPDYKAFYIDNDHFKERFPPADRSDFNHEEFADELTHIMSLPNLECFKFKIDRSGDLDFY